MMQFKVVARDFQLQYFVILSIKDVAVFGGGLHVALEELESGTNEIRRRLQSEGIEIRRLEKIQPSLEDVFVALIEAEEKKAE